MLMRVYVSVALGCAAFLLSGCGSPAEQEKSTPSGKKAPAADGAKPVTLHVKGMVSRLGLY